jgi:small-conductance mechanosensitive channel
MERRRGDEIMGELSHWSGWRDLIFNAVEQLGLRLAEFLPSLLGSLVILGVGWIVAHAVQIASGRALRTVGIDRASARLRIADVFERAELGMTLSQIVARLLFWLVMGAFLLSAIDTLGLSSVNATLERFVAYIPNLLGSALILLGGLLIARFVGNLTRSAAAAAGIAGAPRLGFVAQAATVGLVGVLAMDQLGVDTAVLVLPLAALLASAGFSVGLALALGARPVVTHILAGHFLKQSLPRETFVEIEGQRGIVERVGATDTLLRNGDRCWSVPNGHLLEIVVQR